MNRQEIIQLIKNKITLKEFKLVTLRERYDQTENAPEVQVQISLHISATVDNIKMLNEILQHLETSP